jgi:hypothetical protein
MCRPVGRRELGKAKALRLGGSTATRFDTTAICGNEPMDRFQPVLSSTTSMETMPITDWRIFS